MSELSASDGDRNASVAHEQPMGLAIERAGLSAAAQHIQHLPDAETSIEATYAFAATDRLTIQPDVQYIIHPALAPHLPNALAFGLRFVVNLNAPAGASDTED